MKRSNYYLATKTNNVQNWNEMKQIVLTNITWNQAVDIAKSQASQTRLSESKGYNNQGHYFQPNN